MSVHVGFVVDKLALGQVFLRVLQFSHHHCHPVLTGVYLSAGGWTKGPLMALMHTDIASPRDNEKIAVVEANITDVG
jgi:hypothetical protein